MLLTGSCQNPGLNLKKERWWGVGGGGGVVPVQKKEAKESFRSDGTGRETTQE